MNLIRKRISLDPTISSEAKKPPSTDLALPDQFVASATTVSHILIWVFWEFFEIFLNYARGDFGQQHLWERIEGAIWMIMDFVFVCTCV